MPAKAQQVPEGQMPMLHRQAEIRPVTRAAEGEEVRANEFEVVWTTGARVKRSSFWTDKKWEEELAVDKKSVRLGRLNGGASVLNSHNSWDLSHVIGAVVPGSARMEKGEGLARVLIDDGPETAAILRKIKSGIIRSISVGYVVHRWVKTEREGQPELWRAEDWEPYEISFVPIPADAGAGLRAEGQTLYPCEIINQTRKDEAMPKDKDDEVKETEGQAGEPAAKRDAGKDAGRQLDAERISEDAAKAELERGQEIRKIVRAAGLGEEFAEKLVTGRVALDEARKQVLAELSQRQQKDNPISNHVRVETGEDERDKFLRGASDWILQKAGAAGLVSQHRKEKIEPGEFRGMRLIDLAKECLELRGVKTRGKTNMEIATAAFSHRASITQTTSDFAVLLENTMHKTLLAGYATAEDTWSKFCAKGSVSDFRPHKRYRLGSFGRLDQKNEAGEFKNKSIPDAFREAIQLSTRGNIINISREAIINDDMDAFNRLSTMLGRAAKLSIEMDVYDMIAENAGLGPTMDDGEVLFSTAHANINSTGSALTVEGLDADRAVMARQKDRSGNEFLAIRPAFLLVPTELGGTGRVINDAQYDPDTANKLQKPNKVRGLFREVIDTPWLGAASTRRYLLADPAIAPVFEVIFLDGQEEPYLESQEGFRVDGSEWKVRLDYAADAVDWVGGVTNAGTS